MRSSLLATASGLVCCAGAAAQVVQWDIYKRHDRPSLRRRADGTASATLENEQTMGGYFADIQIGTPPQNLTLQLDTGSSDIWVPYSGASVCREASGSGMQGCSFGSFNPDDSSSFEDLGRNSFHIEYVDNSFATGDFFSDDFTINDLTVQNMTIGLGISTDIPFGLIGVGYALDESSVTTVSTTYPNLPLAMQQAGDINSVAYSLWLNDLDASSGSILFGGVDTEKYVGEMMTINVQKSPKESNVTSFLVDLSVVEASSSSGSDTLYSGKPISAVLDSGTTLSYLPQDLAERIWREVGAEYNDQIQMGVLPCSHASNGGHFSFGFGGPGGPRVNVSMDELVLDLTGGQQPEFPSGQFKGQSACEFGIQNSTGGTFLLGDTFLRSAYVVYDLSNNEIGVAQTDFNATDSNVVAFASQGAAIPSASSAPSQSATVSASIATGSLKAAEGFGSRNGSSGSGGGGDGADSASLQSLSWTGAALCGTLAIAMLL